MIKLMKEIGLEFLEFAIMVFIVAAVTGFFMAVTGAHTDMNLVQFVGSIAIALLPVHALIFIHFNHVCKTTKKTQAK